MLRATMDAQDRQTSREPGQARRTPPARSAAGTLARGSALLASAVAALALGAAAALAPGGSGFPLALLELVPLAALLVAAACLTGYAAGAELQSEIGRAAAAIRGAIRPSERHPERRARPSVAELEAIWDAVERLDERFKAELALYDDALAEVESMDGQRTDLLTAVATELYAPLDRIVALSERLLDGGAGPLDDAKAEDARIVRNAGVRLREMVAEILDLSSLISRDVGLELERLDLAEIAREVVETARGQIGGKKLSIRLEAPDGPVPVEGHRQRLWQIAMNLVGNAIKFTELGSVVVKVAATPEGGARLEVVDTGIGISSPDQATVFDTFKQIVGRAGRGRGTGLGLAICKRLVELHRGRITVSSIIGQGTRFAVTFPPPGGAP